MVYDTLTTVTSVAATVITVLKTVTQSAVLQLGGVIIELVLKVITQIHQVISALIFWINDN